VGDGPFFTNGHLAVTISAFKAILHRPLFVSCGSSKRQIVNVELKRRTLTNRDLLVAPPLVRVSVPLLLDDRSLVVALTSHKSVCIGFLVVLFDRRKDN
jgi:hypothetical protein